MDKLVSAETVDGGKLREAATKKDDQSILLQIANKDMVALEVKYHKRCYDKYTSFLRTTTQSKGKETEQHDFKYEKSFDVFCEEFVKEKLIKQENIFYMKKLKKEFVKTVKRVQNEDAASYRTFRLKEKLHKKFPQLVFHRPKVRTKSDIVYSECLSKGSVAESFIEDDVETSQSSQESDYALDSDDEGHTNIHDTKTATLQEMYAVSLKLRNNLRDHSSSWYESWPPFASDINVDNVKKLVSPLLFNFMAWLLGFSDDPESTGYIALDEKTTAKIFSLCQDMVYVTNGIITQKVLVHQQLSSSDQLSLIKKKQRTVEVPTSDIVPCSIGVKMTPTFHIAQLDPQCLKLVLNEDPTPTAYKLDLAYILMKYICAVNEEVIPGWTGFNTMLYNHEIPNVSRVGYLPVIDAPPTEYSTINTILMRSKEIADKLELKYAVLVFDEAVYAKVQQVR